MADVGAIALSLPGVTASSKRVAWDLDGRMLVWLRPFSKADLRRFGDTPVPPDPIIGVRTGDLDQRDELLAREVNMCFTIPHLEGYGAVLVCLDRADADGLRELITDCWMSRAPAAARAQWQNAEQASDPRRGRRPAPAKENAMVAVGDHVSWNTEQGRTRGKVTQKKTKNFQLAGQKFTASDDDPMFVVKSDKTGSTAAHKPSALRVLKS